MPIMVSSSFSFGWFCEAGNDRSKPFQDVVRFGREGVGSAEALVRMPSHILEGSKCFLFPTIEDPSRLAVYFYEGNDIYDNFAMIERSLTISVGEHYLGRAMTAAMSSIVSIATSGMAAASLRLDVSASNVANVSTTGPLPDSNSSTTADSPSAYIPLQVDQTATADGGTAATVKTISPSYVARSDPTSPYADQNGLVAAPNVELSNEIVQQMVARYTFAMNAQVATTGSQLTKALLDTML